MIYYARHARADYGRMAPAAVGRVGD
jgi:hypothetical protein